MKRCSYTKKALKRNRQVGSHDLRRSLWDSFPQATVTNKPVSMTKAEALRAAKQALKQQEKYHHPFYWAAFTLRGGWY